MSTAIAEKVARDKKLAHLATAIVDFEAEHGEITDDDVPLTHAGVLGQAWRGGVRQARLATALQGIEIRALDEQTGRDDLERLTNALDRHVELIHP